MKCIALKDLLNGLKILNIIGDENSEISGIAYDSRRVKPGYLFVCIEGFKTDGHKFIPNAVQNGAKVLITSREVNAIDGVTIVRVADTRYALAYISDVFFENPSNNLSIIGITGTKGKTTTTYMIKSILEARNRKVGLIGTIVNSIGNEVLPAERTTPESYDLKALFSEMIDKGVNNVVMEVSSHALKLHRVSCTNFEIGIFTNLSQDHMDFHESFDDYFEAKAKLFDMCKVGIVNIDNEYGEKIVKMGMCNIFTIGIDKKADIMATNIKTFSDSVEFRILSPWGEDDIKINIPGKFSIYNALAAIGAGFILGVSLGHMKKGIANVCVPGRAEIVPTNTDYTVMIDYAHSPDSLENILTAVKNYADGRVICVFGCGGDRDKTKRPIMGRISGSISDFTVITSDNPRTEEPLTIIDEIEQGIKMTGGSYVTIEDRKRAIEYAMRSAMPNDIIILAGKGHETYQIFRDKTIHFDEREVVMEVLSGILTSDQE